MECDSFNSSFVDDELDFASYANYPEVNKKLLPLEPQIKPGMRRKSFGGFSAPTVDLSAPYQTYENYIPCEAEKEENTFIDKLAEILNETDFKNNDTDSRCSMTSQTNINNEYGTDQAGEKGLLSFKQRLNNIVSDDKIENVIISDDEIDDDFLRYQITQMKYEDITTYNISEDSDEDINQENSTCEIETENEHEEIIMEHETSNEIMKSNYKASYNNTSDQASNKHATDSENVSILDDTLNDMMNFFENYQDSNEGYKVIEMEEKENSITSDCSSTKNCNTQDSKPSYIPQRKCTKLPTPKATLKSQHILGVKSDYNDIISPVSNYIKNGNIRLYATPTTPSLQANKNIFKTPKPVTSHSKVNNPDKFKNIASPIGMYIKHSATAAINRNMPSCNKQLQNRVVEHFFELKAEPRMMEQFEIPKRIYKPALVNYQIQEKPIRLPNNIKALIPDIHDMLLTKHDGKRLNTEQNMTAVFDNDWDLTNTSVKFDTNDISILHTKPCI